MLGDISTDAISLLKYLLPGFTTAWIFYGLTSHPKPPQFERLIQALIFTFAIQALLPLFKWSMLCVGKMFSLGPWSDEGELLASLVIAVGLGIVVAFFTNKDSFHKWLRRRGFTSRTSHPSEWFCVFTDQVKHVILNLKDGRRLYGWPKEWPVDPDKGQFYIQIPSWIGEDGKTIDLPQLDGILVPVKDVEWVEFVNETRSESDD